MKQRETFLQTLCVLAQIHGFSLTEELICAYDHFLSDLGYDRVTQTLNAFILGAVSDGKFPSAKRIRDVVEGVEDDDLTAEMVAAELQRAVSEFGYPHASAARKSVGELAWLVVERLGGWVNYCARLTNANTPTVFAQTRNFARVVIRQVRKGDFSPPALPSCSQDRLGRATFAVEGRLERS